MTGEVCLTGARTGTNQGDKAREDSALVESAYRAARASGRYVRRRDLYRELDTLGDTPFHLRGENPTMVDGLRLARKEGLANEFVKFARGESA